MIVREVLFATKFYVYCNEEGGENSYECSVPPHDAFVVIEENE